MQQAVATTYEITNGGLLRRVERALRITRGDDRDWMRRAIAAIVITYVPLVVVGLYWRIYEGAWLAGLVRFNTHARALVSIPLLLAAEPFVEARARGFGRYVHDAHLVEGSEDAYARAVLRTARPRDSHLVELALLGLVLASVVASETFAGGLFQWANAPATVVFRFLVFRWLWRWALWGVFLWRLSRLPLSMRATHPDRLGGLGPTLGPAYAVAMVGAAVSATLAGSWADLMVYAHVPLHRSYDIALAFVFVVVALELLPTIGFIPVLYRTRRLGLSRYGAFAHRFTDAFEVKWFDADGSAALGARDFSSLANLGHSYAVVQEMRIIPYNHRVVLGATLWAILPMAPLLIVEIGLPELLERLGKLVL